MFDHTVGSSAGNVASSQCSDSKPQKKKKTMFRQKMGMSCSQILLMEKAAERKTCVSPNAICFVKS